MGTSRRPRTLHAGWVVPALLAATPTAHWLEYMDWADAVTEQPLAIEDGHAVPPERPGNGLAWNPEAVERYRIR